MAQPLGFTNAVAITPHDTNAIVTTGGVAQPVQVYAGTAGTITVITVGGQTTQFTSAVGSLLPVRVTHVKATGTAATLLVAVY